MQMLARKHLAYSPELVTAQGEVGPAVIAPLRTPRLVPRSGQMTPAWPLVTGHLGSLDPLQELYHFIHYTG